MHVIGVCRNHRTRSNRILGVNQQVVVTGVLGLVTGQGEGHVLDTEFDGESLRDSGTVLGRYDEYFCALGGRRGSRCQHRSTQ